MTDQGRLGAARSGVKKGNLVTVLLWGDVLFIIRQGGGKTNQRLIGTAYINGIMQRRVFDIEIEHLEVILNKPLNLSGSLLSFSTKRHPSAWLFG